MNRREKLEQLSEGKRLKNMVIFSDGDELAKMLKAQFKKFKESVDSGIDINADDLLKELEQIVYLRDSVDALKKSINDLYIPDIPKSINVGGLEALIKVADSIAKKEIKIEKIDTKPFINISRKLDSLIQKIEKIKAPIQGQQPSDFVPMRRVMKVGNTLMYDDSFITGSGGGGSSSGGGATTIADGADVAEGATTDAAVTAGSAGTVSGKLRQISADTDGILGNLQQISGNITKANTDNVTVTSTVMASDLATPGTITAINEHTNLAGLNGASSVAILVTGIYTGALTPQVSVDNNTWTTITNSIIDLNTGVVTSTIPSGAQSTYLINTPSIYAFRLIALGAVTGTANITIRGGSGANSGSPLAATSTKQDTGNTSLSSIDTKLTDNATQTTLATRLSESDFDSKVGSLTEAAPATDTASAGLNGRLQRIAQRLTSIIALIPSALTGSGNFKTAIVEDTTSNKSVNQAQIAGTTTDTNSGTKSAGTQRVVIATDQPALTNKLLVTPDSVALPANQSVNQAQVAGTTTDTNSGNKSAGTQRVVIATDQPSLSNSLTVDTELPAAAAITDVLANPTAPAVAAFPMIYSGSTWFRWYAASAVTDGSTAPPIIAPFIYNGTNYDRVRGAANATNTTGTGIQSIANLAQFDDVSPTAITENQFGNLRMSTNRNLYDTIRDAAGNERGANVDAANRLQVHDGLYPLTTALNTYAVRLTTNTTTTPTSSTAYISSIVITTEVAGTTSTVTIKDKQGTPQVLLNGLTTTSASLSPTAINFQTPVKMTSGIDIVTAGAVAGTVDVWINYYQ